MEDVSNFSRYLVLDRYRLKRNIPYILELTPWGLIYFRCFFGWGLFEGRAYSRGAYKII